MVHHDPVTVQYLKVVANYEQTNGGGEEGEKGEKGEKGEDRRGGSVLKKRKRNSAAAGEGGGLSGMQGMQGMQGRPSGIGIDEELEMVVVRDISRCTSTHILVILTCSFSPVPPKATLTSKQKVLVQKQHNVATQLKHVQQMVRQRRRRSLP